MNPRTGGAKRLATGFAGAVNLALGQHGEIYVSELFADQVSQVSGGGPRPLVSINAPAGLEYADGKLYVGYDSLPPEGAPPDGKVATINVGRR